MVLPVASMFLLFSIFIGIISFGVSEFGFKALIIAVPLYLVFFFLVNIIFKKLVQRPLEDLNSKLMALSEGVLDIKVKDEKFRYRYELDAIANSVEKILLGLNRTSGFAKSIAKKQFDKDFELLSNRDELGAALIEMRQSLVDASEAEKQRSEEEAKSNYITSGIAKVGDVLRLNASNIKSLTQKLLSELVDYIGAVQGALYVMAESPEGNDIMEFVGAVAYGRERTLDNSFNMGEGLVGRCAYEKRSVFMTEVPDNYVNITSGLGSANPNCIMLIPAIADDKVYAVLELTSFTVFDKHILKFIESISENIGSTIAGVKNTEQTARLLQDSKQYNEEMASQDEELRQNIEEMQATQEEMQRKENKLKEITAKLEEQETIIRAKIEQLKASEE